MEINRFGPFLGLITITSLTITSNLFPHDFLACPPQGENLSTWYQNILKDDEKELQNEIFTLVDIKDDSEWNNLKNQFSKTYQDACATSTAKELANKPLPSSLINPIYSVLNNRKIRSLLRIIRLEQDPDNMFIKAILSDSNTVTIACGNKKIQADAATDQFTILIDSDELLATHKTPQEIMATLAHEIIHIANEDDFNIFCLDQICQMKKKKKFKIPKKQLAKIKGLWERLQEKRADLLSGLIDIDYAIANRNHFKRNMPPHEHLKPTSTHPTDRERYEYMEKLVNAMKQRRSHTWLISMILFMILSLFITAATQRQSKAQIKF